MYRIIVILILIVILVPGMAFSQLKSQTQPVDVGKILRTPLQSLRGMTNIIGLDPSKLHISQSYSMSYFSIGGQSFAQGIYLNTLEYEFSSPLTLGLQWGYAHAPLNSAGVQSILGSGPFISAARLKYQPSNKISIGIEYNALPYYNQGYNDFNNRNMWRNEW